MKPDEHQMYGLIQMYELIQMASSIAGVRITKIVNNWSNVGYKPEMALAKELLKQMEKKI